MSKDNLALWNSVFKTDPEYTKGFKRAGGFEGTAVDPMYVIRKLTETFGPAGSGWWAHELENKTYTHTDGQCIWMSKIQLAWQVTPETKTKLGEMTGVMSSMSHAIEQWGQTMLVVKRRDGTIFIDEEAPKKAFTDGLTKCASYLGVAGDVHMGLFDDSKYVAERKLEERKARESEEQAERKAKKQADELADTPQRQDEAANKKTAKRERKKFSEKEPAESQSNGEDLEEPNKPFNRAAWAVTVAEKLPTLKDEQAVRAYWSTSVKPTIDELVREGDPETIAFCKEIHGQVKDRLAAVK